MKRLYALPKKMQLLAFMLLSGSVAMAQNSAGDYSAGTNALSSVAEEIAKYVPIMVKLCYAIAGVVAIVGTGREEKDDDGSGSLHLPDSCSQGVALVLRYCRLNRTEDERQGKTLSGLSAVQGAATAS